MKIAILGTGKIAQKAYFPLLLSWPELEISIVYSRTQASTDSAQKTWGFKKTTTNINEVLDQKPDAVLVISSNESHFEFCKLFLENGVDVFAEKPLTIFSHEACTLAEIAEQHSRVLTVGFNRRYALLNQQAREIFGDRRIQTAIIQKHRSFMTYSTMFEQYVDDNIHQIDLMRFFCGDVIARSTAMQRVDGKIAGATSVMDIPDGGIAVLSISNAAGSWLEHVALHGEGISVYVDAFQRLTVIEDDHHTVYGTDRAGKWIRDMRERGFEGEIQHFFDCVETRHVPKTSAFEAAKTQELVESLVKLTGEELNYFGNF